MKAAATLCIIFLLTFPVYCAKIELMEKEVMRTETLILDYEMNPYVTAKFVSAQSKEVILHVFLYREDGSLYRAVDIELNNNETVLIDLTPDSPFKGTLYMECCREVAYVLTLSPPYSGIDKIVLRGVLK